MIVDEEAIAALSRGMALYHCEAGGRMKFDLEFTVIFFGSSIFGLWIAAGGAGFFTVFVGAGSDIWPRVFSAFLGMNLEEDLSESSSTFETREFLESFEVFGSGFSVCTSPGALNFKPLRNLETSLESAGFELINIKS